MAVTVLFFAQSAQWAGRRKLTLPLAAKTTVAALLKRPELRALEGRWGQFKTAVNEELVPSGAEVEDGDEIAIIPPVSGG